MSDFFTNFHFLRPEWLWGLLLCLILTWYLKRQNKPLSAWQDLIAAHLFSHLKLSIGSSLTFQPRHITVLLLAIGFISMAGPSWNRDVPEALDEQAAVIILLNNDASMYAADIAPTRIQRAKQKIDQLLALRPKAMVGLIAFAETAHPVVPVTDDPNFLDLFLDAVEPSLMPGQGKNIQAGLQQTEVMLQGIERPANIIVITDGINEQDISAIPAFTASSGYPVQVLAVGTAKGGPLKINKNFKPEKAIDTRLNVDQFVGLRDAGVPVIGVATDNSDIEWLNRNIKSATENAQNANPEFQWKDSGYTLAWLLIPLGLFWFRRGWTLYSLLIFSSLLVSVPRDSQAEFIDWWLTPDQQGQQSWNSGDYTSAAENFENQYRKGLAWYKAGEYQKAIEVFQQQATAKAAFYEGNSYVQQKRWDEALEAYEIALGRQPEFPQAQENRDKVAAIMVELKKKREDRRAGQNEEAMDEADEIRVDEKGDEGIQVELEKSDQAVQPENWLNGLKVTPAQLLRNKFMLEKHGITASAASTNTQVQQP